MPVKQSATKEEFLKALGLDEREPSDKWKFDAMWVSGDEIVIFLFFIACCGGFQAVCLLCQSVCLLAIDLVGSILLACLLVAVPKALHKHPPSSSFPPFSVD